MHAGAEENNGVHGHETVLHTEQLERVWREGQGVKHRWTYLVAIAIDVGVEPIVNDLMENAFDERRLERCTYDVPRSVVAAPRRGRPPILGSRALESMSSQGLGLRCRIVGRQNGAFQRMH